VKAKISTPTDTRSAGLSRRPGRVTQSGSVARYDHAFFLPRRAARIFGTNSRRVSAIAANKVSRLGNFPSAFNLSTSAANSVGPIFGSLICFMEQSCVVFFSTPFEGSSLRNSSVRAGHRHQAA